MTRSELPAFTDGLPPTERGLAAVATWIGVALCVLDTSIANIALPSIGDQMHATPATALWVVNSYQIAMTMTLLPLASFAEIVGYRRVYLIGTVIFIAASAVSMIAGDLVTLSVARFGQGLGAGGVMAVNPALIKFIYPHRMLGRGIGRNALIVAASSAAGPALAGAVLSIGSWRWLFAINIPFGVLSLAMALRYLPEAPRRVGHYDWISACFTAVVFGSFFLAASDVAHGSWNVLSIGELLGGAITLALLVARAKGHLAPMIPIDLLQIPALRFSYLTSSCAFAASAMALVILPFHLTETGLNTVGVGLAIAPWPIAVASVAPLAGWLSERISASLLGVIGLSLLTLGLCSFIFFGGENPIIVAVGAGLCGAGFALFQTPNNRTMLGSAPPERSGAAGGMLATARMIGQTVGAVVAALLFRVVGPVSSETVMTAAGIAGVAAILSVARLKIERRDVRGKDTASRSFASSRSD